MVEMRKQMEAGSDGEIEGWTKEKMISEAASKERNGENKYSEGKRRRYARQKSIKSKDG